LEQRRPLVVAVYDPRWFLRVLATLRRRGVRYHFYYDEPEVPHGSVVYTDLEDIAKALSKRSDLLVIYDPLRSCRELERAILASMFISEYSSVVVGVDPGHVVNYVVLGDDDLVLYGAGDLNALIADLDYVVNCVPFKEMTIRVGTGVSCGDIIHTLKSRYPGARLELVDESSTTPSRSRIVEIAYISRRLKGLKPFRYKDIYAAYRIALSRGVEVL
jgi:hypothetical protein